MFQYKLFKKNGLPVDVETGSTSCKALGIVNDMFNGSKQQLANVGVCP